MSADLQYFKDLAANLRSNGLDEVTTEEILNETLSDPTLNRADPQASLGDSKAYADSFGRTKNRSRGFKVTSAFAGFAGAILVTKVVTSVAFGVGTSLSLTLIIYSVVAGIFAAGVVAGSIVNRRLPQSVSKRLQS